jgi:hypothetical protein
MLAVLRLLALTCLGLLVKLDRRSMLADLPGHATEPSPPSDIFGIKPRDVRLPQLLQEKTER